MSAEHIESVPEESLSDYDTQPTLYIVEEPHAELSLPEKARIARNPDAAYKEARAINIADTVVEAIAKPLPPYREAQIKMTYFAIDSFFDKITPKNG